MKVLLTSVRLPHALGQVRKLGEAGHEVYATDTFTTAPGLHSRYVKEKFITAAPRYETETFVGQIKDIIKAHQIDCLIPCFEEGFYLAKHHEELSRLTNFFCSPLEPLARLHNKETFTALTQELKIPIAKTITATSREELDAAANQFPEYFARAAFSRGGVALYTNTGPLAGQVKLADCSPTKDNPWLVQEFVHGEDVCSFSVLQHGKVAAHCTYQHAKTIEHAGGIVFESVDEPEAVEHVQKYAAALDLHGEISFDYMKTDKGLWMVECNARPCAGLFMMDPQVLSDAIFNPARDGPVVVPPGVREQIDVALLRDMFREPHSIPEDLELLLSGTEDVYSQKGDRLPALFSLLSYTHVFAFRHRLHQKKHKHSDIMEAQFFDIEWDGGEGS